jgi:predicted nuclease of predicted toxin-antitoxin system
VKVLLDEQLPHRLRTHLAAHDVYTVDYMGWAGLKNGELLRVAEADGFEVFLTGDKNLAYQQSLAGRRMAIITLTAIDFDILKPNLSLIVAAIDSAEPGAFLTVECGTFRRQDP